MGRRRATAGMPANDVLTAFVPLSHLAALLGIERTVARKFALKHGFQPTKRQMKALGHYQFTLCWTPAQVEQMLAERVRQGYELPGVAQTR